MQVTMAYQATAAPAVAPAALVTALGGIDLTGAVADLSPFGVTGIASDTTSAAGIIVTRTLVLNLDPTLFTELFPVACPDRVSLFRNLFTNILANGIFSPVTFEEPVLS